MRTAHVAGHSSGSPADVSSRLPIRPASRCSCSKQTNRLVIGSRPSLAVAVLAAAVALMIGALWDAVTAVTGWFTDEVLMRTANFVLVFSALYVVLALRSVTPLVLSPIAVLVLRVGVFAVVGWPYVARGVQAIVSSELKTDYTLAARAVGVTGDSLPGT